MDGYGLEPDAAERAELLAAMSAWAERFMVARPSAPAVRPEMPGDLDGLADPPAADGRPVDEVIADFERAIGPGFDTAAGGFLSYIPSGGIFTSAVGSFLGAASNQYTGASHASPGAVALERGVIDWMTSLFGLPDSSGGILLSGGSLSNQTAVVAARDRFPGDFRNGRIYVSERAHHSVEKAAHLAGLGVDQTRIVATDDRLRLDTGALRQAIEADSLDPDVRPMMIVATAGTTDVGSIDPLHECADVATETGAWFHVDAAYGGFFQLTDRGRQAFTGIERADSITIDAHKSLLLPFGFGGLLVRDVQTLVDSHWSDSVAGAYMRDLPDALHNYEIGPELTRPFRGIALWLPLQLHGVHRFTDTLDQMLDLARDTAAALDQLDGVTVVLPPELSIVAFHADAGDDATQAVLDYLLASGELHLSSTQLNGRLTLRLAFLNQRTTARIAERAIELIGEALGRS